IKKKKGLQNEDSIMKYFILHYRWNSNLIQETNEHGFIDKQQYNSNLQYQFKVFLNPAIVDVGTLKKEIHGNDAQRMFISLSRSFRTQIPKEHE
ncbi:hypothetical protein L9F63_023347, partial [Diploptera punctata]